MATHNKKGRPTKGGNTRTPNEGNVREPGDNTEIQKVDPPLRKGNPKPEQQVKTR